MQSKVYGVFIDTLAKLALLLIRIAALKSSFTHLREEPVNFHAQSVIFGSQLSHFLQHHLHWLLVD